MLMHPRLSCQGNTDTVGAGWAGVKALTWERCTVRTLAARCLTAASRCLIDHAWSLIPDTEEPRRTLTGEDEHAEFLPLGAPTSAQRPATDEQRLARELIARARHVTPQCGGQGRRDLETERRANAGIGPSPSDGGRGWGPAEQQRARCPATSATQ